ncbi:winged helix-turn-helix domain-containing protein [Streptomyces sp. A1-5]|uniref:winged helix-turn-helix domain-containing protein n=1 Tax=Streptomyces sp. A1-5 TaxID=2738410 RepID=UPI001F19345D|nr:winged helix-turn-helix domain-containing protein [Streptomyces sp. A1-5]UJB39520.1 winged helix-turn-helix domain-containing protein [Streptomyces sp. A1-5]UJB46250.1 winged helix-turn-helix domain-containing protein [Streptomyces sp. A1-5]
MRAAVGPGPQRSRDRVHCRPACGHRAQSSAPVLDGSFEALADAPRSGRPPRWTREDLDALEAMLDTAAAEGTTWTLPALAEWLRRERGVNVDSSWLSVLLHRDGFRWKRTRDSLRHKAGPALQAAAWERLEGLRLYG